MLHRCQPPDHTQINICKGGEQGSGSTEVGSTETGSIEAGSKEVSFIEVSFIEVGCTQVGSKELGFAEVSSTEVSSTEVGSRELGFAEVSSTEVGFAEVGSYLWMLFSPTIPNICALLHSLKVFLVCHVAPPVDACIINVSWKTGKRSSFFVERSVVYVGSENRWSGS